ncbi:MAG: Sec-independent protein translocase protein TatB [Magnetovibrio sp.]|nr:Sec-independent protein translocase protein TatB [Magnetovibrio sp.]
MFDIGLPEFAVVAILALIVVGPKELPKTIKTVMGLIKKAKSMARDFQSGVDEMVREADIDSVKKQLTEGSDELKKELENSVGADIAKDLNLSEDETRKVISNDDDDLDLDEVMEPGDDAEATTTAAAPDDDDDDVMPIAAAPKPDAPKPDASAPDKSDDTEQKS